MKAYVVYGYFPGSMRSNLYGVFLSRDVAIKVHEELLKKKRENKSNELIFYYSTTLDKPTAMYDTMVNDSFEMFKEKMEN